MAAEDVNVTLGRLDERFKNIVQTLHQVQGGLASKDDLAAVSDRVRNLEEKSQTKEAAQALGIRVGKVEDFQTWAIRLVVGAVLTALLAGGYIVSAHPLGG